MLRSSRSMSEDHTKPMQHLGIDESPWLDHDGIVLSPISIEEDKSNGPPRTTIALALLCTILGLTIQIEAIAYYQDVLGWPKPFFSLYLTHSSLALPWLTHMWYLRTQRRSTRQIWFRRYRDDLLTSVASVDAYVDRHNLVKPSVTATPIGFIFGAMAIVTAVLTISGVSWFIALAYTTPADLTAIYNCSAFFAAIFSVPLLKQKLRRTSIIAVALSIIGTMIIAYGDAGSIKANAADSTERVGTHRLTGNLIAAVGSVAFGLYSVIFKRWTSIQTPRHASSSFDLTVAASGLTGAYTFVLGWIAILLLHFLDIEPFVIPSAQVIVFLAISLVTGAASMTLLLLLVTWTTPVFGSVTSVLSVFFVAIADWLLFGLVPSSATYIGGGLIFVAFGLLAQDGMS